MIACSRTPEKEIVTVPTVIETPEIEAPTIQIVPRPDPVTLKNADIVVVTEANLDYIGSISVDKNLLDAANLQEHEKVHVLNITNGARLETYVISSPFGSGEICINGAAAHLINPNDRIIILSYCSINKTEVENFQPTIVKVNDKNEIIH